VQYSDNVNSQPETTDYEFKSNCAAEVLISTLQRSMNYEHIVQLIVTMDFQGAKWLGHGIDPPPSSTEAKE
jgi:hypothetical protein